MKPKAIIKITVDILMTIFMLLLMAYYITGEQFHEWLGAITFLLFAFHHVINWSWIRNLYKGTYNAFRIVQVIINALLFLCLIGQMISGIILSRYVFTFLPITGGTNIARSLHHVCAYWAFILISVHIGQHWGMMLGMARKFSKGSAPQPNILRTVAALIAGYGIYAFVTRQFPQYMFNKIQFSFFDYDAPIILFFLDYFTIMGLFVLIGHYATRLIRIKNTRKGLQPEAPNDEPSK